MKLKLKQFIYIIVIAVFILITVFPIFWALVSSLRSDEEIFRYAMPFSWRTFVPDKLTFQSYINIFVKSILEKYCLILYLSEWQQSLRELLLMRLQDLFLQNIHLDLSGCCFF